MTRLIQQLSLHGADEVIYSPYKLKAHYVSRRNDSIFHFSLSFDKI